MLTHLHQPDIDRVANHQFDDNWPRVYRHLDECELCLRRLLDTELRLTSESPAPAARRVGFL